MINLRRERKAVYDVGNVFTAFNWIFREQPVVDFGIDAIVELTNGTKPTGEFFAVQIKGGEKNFHRGKKGITYYISERHYFYWLSVKMPMFLVLQDPLNDQIYWSQIKKSNITKTNKQWKIVIPTHHILDITAKEQIQQIVENHFQSYQADSRHYSIVPAEKKEPLELSYYVAAGKTKDLWCVLTDGSATEKQKLGYIVTAENWDKEKAALSWEDPFYFTLSDLENYLQIQYHTLIAENKSGVIKLLKNEIDKMVADGGIEGIARKMFDMQNHKDNIPKYDNFIKAFERHSGLKKGMYTAQALGEIIHFRTEEDEFEINTYEGKTASLRTFINNRSYDEIYTETNESIWSEIYLDYGVEKEKFIPQMMQEWERYWDELYKDIKERIGETDHLDESKNKSWRQMQAFMEGYNDAGDIIEYACKLSEDTLYPIVVITMMKIFDAEVFYEEYCELEFWSGRYSWENIASEEGDDDGPIFFIRPTDY